MYWMYYFTSGFPPDFRCQFRRHETISSARRALSRSRSCRSWADSMATTTADSWIQLGGFSENDGNDGRKSLWKIRRWLDDGNWAPNLWKSGDDWRLVGDDVCWCGMKISALAVPCASRDGKSLRLYLFRHDPQCPRDYYWSQRKLTEQPFPCGVPFFGGPQDHQVIRDPSKVESQSVTTSKSVNIQWEGISLRSFFAISRVLETGRFLVQKNRVPLNAYPTDSCAWSSFSQK